MVTDRHRLERDVAAQLAYLAHLAPEDLPVALRRFADGLERDLGEACMATADDPGIGGVTTGR